MQGWISLHRKIRQNPVFADLQLFRLWIICLTEASHKEHQILVGKQVVELLPGQFVTGRFELQKMYNEGLKKKDCVSDLTVWRWFKTLETLDFLHINSNNKFSLCTVVKWQDYQNVVQQNEQQMNNKRTTDVQQMYTNNNGNKGNKGKKENTRQQKSYDEDSVYFKISEYLLEQIRKMNPDVKQPDLQKWSDEVRLMIEVDKRPIEDVREMMKWMYTKDTFWRTVTLSTAKLRKNYDQINAKRLSTPSIHNSSLNIPDARYKKLEHDPAADAFMEKVYGGKKNEITRTT